MGGTTIDILVNNAGIGARVPAIEIDPDVWAKVVEVNLNGAFLCAREVAKVMLAQHRGAIVAIGSIMGSVGPLLKNYFGPGLEIRQDLSQSEISTYCCNHRWRHALPKRSLSRDQGRDGQSDPCPGPRAAGGVRVDAVAPAFVRTPLTEALPDHQAALRTTSATFSGSSLNSLATFSMTRFRRSAGAAKTGAPAIGS